MKIVKASNGKNTIKMSKSEWVSIGKKAGWMRKAMTLAEMEILPDDNPQKEYFNRLVKYYTDENHKEPDEARKKQFVKIVERKDKELSIQHQKRRDRPADSGIAPPDLYDLNGKKIDLSLYDDDDDDY